jgi:lysophospholipase L1-like esterase
MIEMGKGAGLKVLLGNLPPQNPNACMGSTAPPGCVPDRNDGAQYVVPFNSLLPQLAASEGVPLVDVYTAFHGDVTTLIDNDGLHPTAAGYEVIAQTFLTTIEKTFEITSTSSNGRTTLILTVPRRR